jgi:hypothetical protein
MFVMSTRYLSRSDLRSLLLECRDPLGERAGEALDPNDAELLPVSAGGLDETNYEVRLARSEAGERPTTLGLRAFVEALGRPMTEPESVGFGGSDGSHFMVLLDGGHVVAITAVAAR